MVLLLPAKVIALVPAVTVVLKPNVRFPVTVNPLFTNDPTTLDPNDKSPTILFAVIVCVFAPAPMIFILNLSDTPTIEPVVITIAVEVEAVNVTIIGFGTVIVPDVGTIFNAVPVPVHLIVPLESLIIDLNPAVETNVKQVIVAELAM